MAELPPTVARLEAVLGIQEGTLEGVDRIRALRALDDAATLVLAEVPGPRAALWEHNTPDVVELVALKAARREFENPEGISTESLVDRTVTVSESSGVYLTAREVALVRRAATQRTGGRVASLGIRSAYGSGDYGTVYVPSSNSGGDPIPFLDASDIPR